MMKVLVVLMLVCSVYAEEKKTLSVRAALRELTVEVKNLQAENKELAAKLDKLEDQQTEVEKLNATLQEQAAKQQTEQEKQLQEQAAKLDKLENQQTEVEKLKKQLQGKQVAFSASLWASGSQTFGPFNRQTPLVFKRVVTNIGNAYNPHTGVFTAPLRGAYHFEWHVYQQGSHQTGAVLMKNSKPIFIAYEYLIKYYASASQGVTLILEAGDVLSVSLYTSAAVFDNHNHHTTFSGHMLFTM